MNRIVVLDAVFAQAHVEVAVRSGTTLEDHPLTSGAGSGEVIPPNPAQIGARVMTFVPRNGFPNFLVHRAMIAKK